ncbi:Calcipressin-like protein [Spathaspora sp. JA1]|nr:Calcipressin-like protein [Spathaspora sp. JA1]
MRNPTNTLILKNLPNSILSDPQELLESLQGYLIEVIILTNLQRILIICESSIISQHVYNIISKSFPQVTVSYSLYDNEFNVTNQDQDIIVNSGGDFQYLELPSDQSSRRFLISPPLSPPPGWDHWDKVESGPSSQTIHSLEELSHLLWQRLGNQEQQEQEQEDIVRKVKGTREQVDIKKQPELLFKDIKQEGVPAIILDSIDGSDEDIAEIHIPKTTLPPPLSMDM